MMIPIIVRLPGLELAMMKDELLQAQLRDEMAQKILHAWEHKKQTRTIGFCSSIRQADFFLNYFNEQG